MIITALLYLIGVTVALVIWSRMMRKTPDEQDQSIREDLEK